MKCGGCCRSRLGGRQGTRTPVLVRCAHSPCFLFTLPAVSGDDQSPFARLRVLGRLPEPLLSRVRLACVV